MILKCGLTESFLKKHNNETGPDKIDGNLNLTIIIFSIFTYFFMTTFQSQFISLNMWVFIHGFKWTNNAERTVKL